MRGYIRATVLIVGAAVAIAIVIEGMRPTQAMPPFAEGYGINCEVCHTNIPALNAYGRYIQRTGYASLDAATMHNAPLIWIQEAATYDTGNATYPSKVLLGNFNGQLAGWIGNDVTIHAQQWAVNGNEPGFTDTLWLTYNNLLHRDGHLTVGKLENPAPSPFSMWFELAGFNPPSMTVGEHVYELGSNRWGAKLQYVRKGYIVEGSYLGANGNLNTAFDFSTPTDKTFQYRAAYTNAAKPIEAGVYGATGSWPLSDGTYDHYTSETPYIEIDAQHNWPGLFALYQFNHDANYAAGAGAVNSYGYTIDVFKPFYNSKVMLGARYESTNDNLGTVNHFGYVNLGVMLSRHVSPTNANALMLNGQVTMIPGSSPTWQAQLLFNTTLLPLRSR